jgi:hypothetical protein
MTYTPTTPHIRDDLRHDLTTIKTDLSPTVVTSDASGFAAVLIFSSDPQQIHNLYLRASETWSCARRRWRS